MKTLLAAVALTLCGGAYAAETLTVGPKRFTESYILGEIDVYSEYTGTIEREILKSTQPLGIRSVSNLAAHPEVALGLPPDYRLRLIELPLASRSTTTQPCWPARCQRRCWRCWSTVDSNCWTAGSCPPACATRSRARDVPLMKFSPRRRGGAEETQRKTDDR